VVTETIDVRGMYCGGCEQRLREALLALDGVSEAQPEHIGDLVDVTFDPALVGIEQIRETVRACGFVPA